jgi:hypothetical protein
VAGRSAQPDLPARFILATGAARNQYRSAAAGCADSKAARLMARAIFLGAAGKSSCRRPPKRIRMNLVVDICESPVMRRRVFIVDTKGLGDDLVFMRSL